MRSLPIALLATTVVLTPLGAAAQSVDEEGAAVLEAQVLGLLDQLFMNAPDVMYQLAGDINATPDGDFYAVSIPGLTVEIDDDVRGTLQAFEATVTPLDNGWQRAQWSFPSPIAFVNPRNENENATVSFASEDNEMVIAPQYGMALDGRFALNDILATTSEDVASLTIDQIAVAVDTDDAPAGPDTYDSSSNVTLSNLVVDVDGEGRFSLGGLELSGHSERQRFDLFAQLNERVRGLEPESEAYTLALIDVLRENRDEKWLGDASVSVGLRDLSLVSDDATGSIEALSVVMSADGLDQTVAHLGLQLEATNFSSANIPPDFARVVPTQATLDLQAADTPIDAISRELYAFLGDAPSDDELFGPKGRRANAGGSIPNWQTFDPTTLFNIVMASETQVLVENLFVEAPIGYIAAEGTIQPDPQAVMQMVASIDLDIAGLPEMIAFAQETGGDAAQAAGLASALSAMGRDGVDENGVAIKEFDLELTATGQMLLNGNDMSAMMGMFQ